MVNIVKIRGSVFAPYALLKPIKDAATGRVFEYAGDAREFTPFAVNTKRSRLEQEVIVDFYKREIFTYVDACIVTVKITNSDGSIEYQKGETSTENIVCTNIVWGEDEVSFEMRASASNPLNAAAPAADYFLTIRVNESGTVHVEGVHDGFPCYEFYKQIDFRSFEKIYTHDFRETDDTPAALAGEMEYSFKTTI
ncbi:MULTISPECIES: DUF3238 domain-containing protein [Bacillus]|uniref:DUF3238 domain-containing protein n=1 Tax=Bacillus TaxID=1386 RepID=UPI0003300670|nr:DUF3238 domain-containing protein [Bacillus wiedmannii]EOP05476.1 hypothetical protein ICS_04824 [Bacillus cereus BAG2O-3]EOQ15060.1 hypothetical protein KQ3_00065 [Bacillus cereus B5-2]EOQ34527.1 hypothetical protein KQ1_00670 [Bacillus cereus BAG3O-1]MBJ8118711.1 DUF3238 domain-containing protein [Bacillus cereus]PFW77803.1 DUF3238 domain-containing protein [Bacillus sp. AFS075960]RFB11637.1 DUF3238 domain-containing protein [Bacillus sp. OE]RFB28106.1 DUF3238 domain-containing protein 